MCRRNLFFDAGRDEIVGFEDFGEDKKRDAICKNALVIMARGLYSPWKQPIAYFFVGTQMKAKDLRSIFEECIVKLCSIGFHVEGIASDMGSNFIELAKLLGVTAENPEFQFGGQSLLYIFDPCHLLKATRNNLLKHFFCFGGKKTSWSFIKYFYEQDKKQFYICAPKLTSSHINPSSFKKMRVSFAAQLISRTVASGMNTYLTLNALLAESIGTIDCIVARPALAVGRSSEK